MDTTKTRQLQALGVVFAGCGVTFLSVGFATDKLALWVMGPAFLGLGIVFFAYARLRKK